MLVREADDSVSYRLGEFKEKSNEHTGFKPTAFGKPRIREEGSKTLVSRLKVIKLFRDAGVGGKDASEALSRGHPRFRQDDRASEAMQSRERRLGFTGGEGEFKAKHDT
jgi:hypothetical protein